MRERERERGFKPETDQGLNVLTVKINGLMLLYHDVAGHLATFLFFVKKIKEQNRKTLKENQKLNDNCQKLKALIRTNIKLIIEKSEDSLCLTSRRTIGQLAFAPCPSGWTTCSCWLAGWRWKGRTVCPTQLVQLYFHLWPLIKAVTDTTQ